MRFVESVVDHEFCCADRHRPFQIRLLFFSACVITNDWTEIVNTNTQLEVPGLIAHEATTTAASTATAAAVAVVVATLVAEEQTTMPCVRCYPTKKNIRID